YNAAGQKVQKVVTQGSDITTTDYLGGYQYKKETSTGTVDLQFFPTAEGYVEYNAGTYKYVYQYKDHLGNVRLSYDKALVIQEENNYYPFGLKHIGYGYSQVVNSNYKYRFNGKELQDELGLNMTAMDFRQYDNALGRFNSIDALSEMNYSTSPFTFGYNNPVYWSDPSGLLSQAFIDSIWKNSSNGSKWVNDGAGNFDKIGSNGFVNKEGEYHEGSGKGEALPNVTIISGIGDKRNGDRIRGNAYLNGQYYQHWRDDQSTKRIDDFQSGLDGLGTIDPTGIVDGLNSIGYLMRGQTGNAAIAAIGIIPYLGDAAKGAKYSKGAITASELLRIENAATRIGKPITVVGSRASGTAKAFSDWDYVIEGGLNSKNWSKIKNSLPGSKSTIDNMARNIDIFTGTVRTELPHITVLPRK
uniref:RHS repeat-associated core domain-containing protein n=1 Tax=Flavobacterium adhaerens TaxID=3149043 RepID=UPI0032B41766